MRIKYYMAYPGYSNKWLRIAADCISRGNITQLRVVQNIIEFYKTREKEAQRDNDIR